MQQNEQLWIKLLGSPQLFMGRDAVPVSRKRVRALLFYLAAERKEVGRDTLAYLLWPENDSDSANLNLSVCVSYLKRALGSKLVYTRPDTISIARSIPSDLHRFRRLANSSSVEDKILALRMWDKFMDGFNLKDSAPFEQWIQETASELSVLYNKTVLDACRILEELGRYLDALDILSTASVLDPLNEDFCRLRMKLLHRTGKTSSVSRVYSSLVSALNKELAVPPSPETIAVYQDILSSELSANAQPQTQAKHNSLYSWEMVFAGRKAQMDILLSSSSTRFTLLQGQAGMGKTRLALEYINRSSRRSVPIYFKQQEQAMPYFAVIKYVRSLMASADWVDIREKLRSMLHPEHNRTLCSLIPEFPGLSTAPPPSLVLTAQHIFTAFEHLFGILFFSEEALFFLDDIQYADSHSLELFRYLISADSLRNLRFIATFRPELSTAEIMSFFNTIQRESSLQILEIGKLDSESMTDILLYYFPDMDPDSSERLIDLSDGNPYWLKTIIYSLDSGYTEFSGKFSLEKLFKQQLNSLSAEALLIVERFAVYGDSCDKQLFSALCAGASPEKIYFELASARILSMDASENYIFAHSLIYDYVLQCAAAKPKRIKQMHSFVARAIEMACGGSLSGPDYIAISDNYKNSGNPELGADYAKEAGAYLLSVNSKEQAASYMKYAVSYQELPKRFDSILLLHDCLMQTDRAFEAGIFLQNSISLAKNMGWREYLLTMEALDMLSRHTEYAEAHAGILPAYLLDLDPAIESKLLEALELVENSDNLFLTGQICMFLSEYYRMTGCNESAKLYLFRISRHYIPILEKADTPTKLLLLAAFRDLISILNHEDNAPQLFSVINMEKQLFSSFSAQSYLSTDLGVKAMLEDVRGNYSESDRITRTAIAEARSAKNHLHLACGLVIQATRLRKNTPLKSYSLNHEALSIAKGVNARYTIARALTGLVLTSPNIQDAYFYFGELEQLSAQVGSPSLNEKTAALKEVLQLRSGREN